MSKSNIKLLTKKEREYFKEHYNFELQGNVLLVNCIGYGRVVAHPIDKQFSILSKVRKITISVDAIRLWIEKFKETKYNVVDIQNAMNALLIGYQPTDYNDIKNQLEIIEKKDEVF